MRTRTKLRTALRWAFATTGGITASTLLAATPTSALAVAELPDALVGLAGGAVIGGVLGGAQWLELRQQIEATGWWVPASATGGMIGLTSGVMLADMALPTARATLPATVVGVITGGFVGGAQALVLRRQARPVGAWITANALGWSAGFGLAATIADIARIPVGLLAGGAVAGVVTGMALARLLPPEDGRRAGLKLARRSSFQVL